jgi:RNA polymerase sigma-70 factor (ECF subfamily)
MNGTLIPTVLIAGLLAEAAADRPDSLLKYGDDRADGKKSLGGSGELIRSSAPASAARVSGLRIHGSRYGTPEAPDESFLVYILSEDQSEVLHTELAPYRLFERGAETWVDVKFKKPQPVPRVFWIALDFRAQRTKGVYVSYDNSTSGQYSKVGLPGLKAADVDFAGDWMIQVRLAR